MEVKDLQREVIDAERLAERGKVILNLNEQLAQEKQKNQTLEDEKKALQAELEAMKPQPETTK